MPVVAYAPPSGTWGWGWGMGVLEAEQVAQQPMAGTETVRGRGGGRTGCASTGTNWRHCHLRVHKSYLSTPQTGRGGWGCPAGGEDRGGWGGEGPEL